MLSGHPATRALAGPLPAEGLRTFADRYDVVLCDLWGVIHDGRRAFGAAIDAMRRFRQAGGTVVFITNAPRPRDSVLEQIGLLGVPDDAFDALVTSGDVTISAIAAGGECPVHHIGPDRDRALFDAMRETTGLSVRLVPLVDADRLVVTGLFDDATETPAHYAATLRAARSRDLELICANPDIVVHVGDQLIYCAGALAEAYEALGGRTLMAGKPHPPIYEAALALAARRRGGPTHRSRVLAVGDGLITDGAGAAREGIDLLFITSGIHREDFHPEPDAPWDAGRYADRMAAEAHPPKAAMRHLAW